MRTTPRSLVLLSLLAALLVAAGTSKGTADGRTDAELKKLRGAWKVVSVVKSGEELEPVVRLGLEFTFDGGTLTVTSEDQSFATQVKSFRIDPSCNPMLMDLADSAKALREREQVVEAIYRIQGKTLTWCCNLEDDRPAKGNRPTALESKAGSNALLFTLKRAGD
jgi:uncharacterized protein (TIGR03067 family)